MTDTTLINGAYGSERVPVPDAGDGSAVAAPAAPAVQPDGSPQLLNDVAMAGQPGFAAAQQQRAQAEFAPHANLLESAGGSVDQWVTTKILKRLSRPSFADDTPINQFEYLEHTPLSLNDDERDYFLSVGKGDKSAAYAISQIEDQRKAQGAMGTHPIAAFGTGFFDPALYATGGVGNLARLTGGGRIVAATIGGTAQLAMSAAGEGPVSDKDLTMALLGGSLMSAWAFKGGKLAKRDKDFPSEELNSSLTKAGTSAPLVVPTSKTPPAVATGMTRYYHGGNPEGVAGPLWFTSDLNDAKGWASRGEGMKVWYTDIPTDHPSRGGDATFGVLPPSRAELPAEFAEKRKLFIEEDANSKDMWTHLNGVAKRLGFTVTEGADASSTGKAIVAPAGANDQLAHEIGHSIASGSGVDVTADTIPNFDEVLKVAQAFRPGIHNHPNPATRAYAGTASEVLADAIGSVLQGKAPVSIVRPWMDKIGMPESALGLEARPPKDPLAPGAQPTDMPEIAAATHKWVAQNAVARNAQRLAWNMHKTMSSFGAVGKKVANLLYDNNADLSLNSIESHREAILSDLRQGQIDYEQQLRDAVKSQANLGTLDQINPFRSRAYYSAQASIEQDVQREMFRRETLARQGREIGYENIPKHVKEMADTLGTLMEKTRKEMQSSGVHGAENLQQEIGYLPRRWSSQKIEDAINTLKGSGLSQEAAEVRLSSLLGGAVRRASAQGMTPELSDSIGRAIMNRALRKGYFEDSVFNLPAGEGQMKELRDILKGGGLSHQEVEHALSVLRVASDDAGKSGFLKHRLDVDYTAQLKVGNKVISVPDLIDNRVTSIVDSYLKGASTQAAFARKGFAHRSDIEDLRTELLHDTPLAQRDEASKLFDDSVAYLRGDPAGARIDPKFRLAQAYGRSIALAQSGLWQLMETSNIAAKWGLGKTVQFAMQEFPGFKGLMNPTKEEATTLAHVLSENSTANMRLRPYLAKFEDGYDMNPQDGAMFSANLAAQAGGQVVPMANLMKYVHHWQAKITGNLISERLERAAGGDLKARAMLESYGLESPVMDKLALEIKAHGMDVDKWSDAVWAGARPAFAKMMDEAVLRARLGDMPAWAAFDQVGKFIFSYRSFVLAAHNKIMVGTAQRNGLGALGMLMSYSFPLAYLAQASSNMLNNKPATVGQTVAGAMGQMGGFGLFSEPLKWVTGQSNSFGAPGLIPIDRGIKLIQNIHQGNAGGAASTAMQMVPVVSAIPAIKAIASQVKEIH